jgi:hypothetical protein
MKRILWLMALVALLAVAPTSKAQGPSGATEYSRTAGVYMARNYGRWRDTVFVNGGGSIASGTGVTIPLVSPTVALADGRTIIPFYAGVRVTIGAGSVAESVAITSTNGCVAAAAPGACTIVVTTANNHGNSEPVTTGSNGIDEAVLDAASGGMGNAVPNPTVYGGEVLVDGSWVANGGTTTSITGDTLNFFSVVIRDERGPTESWWTNQPKALTALATPATQAGTASAACTGANTVCDGTAVGTWTNAAIYFCQMYVDMQGQVSPCGATANYTTAGSVAITSLAPAASTGAVGWLQAIGTSYAAAYRLPVTSANCTLSTLTPIPSCAMSSNGSWPTPTTANVPLHNGYVVATYNPNDLSHTTFQYQQSAKPPSTCALESNFGPFLVTAGGTTTQQQVVGSVEFLPACLNQLNKSIRITGKISDVAGSGETPKVTVMLGPTFTTGTPTAICTLVGTTTTGTGVTTSDTFTCDMNVNAIGAAGTGKVMPNGSLIVQNTAGTVTASTIAADTATAAITNGLTLQNVLYIVYTPTSATNTSAQLLALHIEDL